METICQQCGDKGVEDALVYCVKCLNFAVHRYCLPTLPETFDEFVHWFCEDCEPKSVKQSPLEKPCSTPFVERNHVMSEGVQVTYSRKNLKQNDVACRVAETEEHLHPSSPSQQPCDAKTKLDLIEHTQLAHDSSSLKTKLKVTTEKESTCPVTLTEENRHQNSPSQQPPELNSKLALTDSAQLVSDYSLPKKKLRRIKKGFTRTVAEAEDQRQQSSSTQQHSGTQTKPDLTNHAQLAQKLRRIKKGFTRTVAEAEDQRQQSSPSQKRSGTQTNLDSTEHAQLAGDCSALKIKLRRKKKDVTTSVAEPEEQNCQNSPSQEPFEAHLEHALCVGSPPLNESRTISSSSEKLGNDLKLGKRRRLILEGSELGEEAESVRIADSQLVVADSQLGVADSQLVVADSQLGVADSQLVVADSQLGVADSQLGVADSQLVVADLSNDLELSDYLLAQPIIDPIWRGSFSIYNKDYGLLDGVVAHLSSKACPKVCEEASLLPALLRSEILPKTDVWPKSFQKSEPCDDHIGLYFFSEDKRYESLVDDMMHQELALRAIVRNAELLVFPSTELPLLYWKFLGKYYLWGVFRPKKASSPDAANHDLVVVNSNIECASYSKSANGMDTDEERNLTKTKNWNARSPLSPLSNCSSSG
ncbi:hypothetical protein CsSME_00035154 [Camellia sinensis var. sinensis]